MPKTPGGEGKKAHHPHRIYFTRTPATAREIAREAYPDRDASILTVSLDGIEGLLARRDPDFPIYGFYVTSSIPPENIRHAMPAGLEDTSDVEHEPTNLSKINVGPFLGHSRGPQAKPLP